MPSCGKPLVAAVGAWHAACLAVRLACGSTIARIAAAGYTALVGDIQASYGVFDRIASYIMLVVVTVPATVVSLRLLDALCQRRGRWGRTAVAFTVWEAVVVAILVWSYEVAFPYRVNQLAWAIFGPPRELYSFQNLVLPRVVAWLICTTPIAGVMLWLYDKLSAASPVSNPEST
jgi:hypothetical protein